MRKKFLSVMFSITLILSVTACGGSDTDTGGSSASVPDNVDTSTQESADENKGANESELVYNEANGLRIALPADYTAVDAGVDQPVFANADKTALVTVNGPLVDDTASPDQLTEEMFALIYQEGGYSDVTIDNAGVVEQPDGAAAAVAFAVGSMPDGDRVNTVMQYYFLADGSGSYYIVNYVYPLDDTAVDDVIADVLASVTAAGEAADTDMADKAGEDTGEEFSLWDAAREETPDLSDTAWNICGGYLDGREMTQEELDTLLEAYGGTCQFVFDANGGAQMVQGSGGLTGTYEYLENGDVGVVLDADGTELNYGCIFTDMDGLTMIAISDEDGQNGLYFAQ